MLRTSACVGEMRNRVLASSETCEEAGAAQWRILTDADEILRRNEAVVIRFNKKVIEKGDERAFQELMAQDFVNRAAAPGAPSGPEAMLATLNRVLRPAFPDLTVDIHDQLPRATR